MQGKEVRKCYSCGQRYNFLPNEDSIHGEYFCSEECMYNYLSEEGDPKERKLTMQERIKLVLAELISNWEELTPKQQFGFIISAMACVASLAYAGGSGIWFMNPFNPATWANKYLKARLFHMASSLVSAGGIILVAQGK